MPKSKVAQPAALPNTYFGLPDASKEAPEKLLQDHVTRKDIDPLLKYGSRVEGAEIIVGIKGSGKTGLRRFVELSDATALSWIIDADHNILNLDPSALKGRSGILKNVLALEILRSFASNIAEQYKEYGLSKTASDNWKKISGAVVSTLKNVPEAVEVDAKIAKINLAKLLKTNGSTAVNKAFSKVVEDVNASLKGRRAYIMIDDVDDVFPDIEDNPIFVEGLARAVYEINLAFAENIHALLFLKYGIWRRWFENQQEYDRVRHVVIDLTWNHDSLCLLVARRICRINNIKLPPGEVPNIEKIWGYEFDWDKKKGFARFSHEFTDLCVSGARDIVVLINQSKRAAGDQKIMLSHLLSHVKQYSEGKLYEINADFGNIYPEITTFISNVFHGCKIEMTGKEVFDLIEKNGLTKPKVDDYFKKFQWYSGSKERIASIMYEVGLIGIRRQNGKTLYSIEVPTINAAEIRDSSVIIHPAFRPFLGTAKR